MARVSFREDRNTWEVRWRELRVTVDENGEENRAWKWRKRTCPSKKAAEALKLRVETAASQGDNWTDQRETPTATIGAISIAYTQASYRARPEATAKHRASLLNRFVAWAGPDRPVSDLTVSLLTGYADVLRAGSDGKRAIRSVSRYVGVVEKLWTWAYNRLEKYPGVPQPRKITGSEGEVEHAPAPVALGNPTWEDVDAMIRALSRDGAPQGQGQGYGYRPQWETHRRIALFQRYQGLRVSQILSLTWDEVDLDRGWLVILAGKRGAKGQVRSRIVPLHPALVAELAGWGVREGHLFARLATKGPRRGQAVVPRGDAVSEVFTAAWKRAGVSETKWGAQGRVHARPTNAIRARWKSTIAGSFGYDVAKMLAGQAVGGEHDAYVVMGDPEASPYWTTMVRALQAIPTPEESEKVVSLAR